MGEGRNALYLAAQGYRVTGIDISYPAVAKCLRQARQKGLVIGGIVADLERFPIKENEYDLMVNFYYLQRDLIPQIKAGLKPGGMVVFETYTQEQTRYGHPLNPDYLLKPNELLDLFRGMRVLVYRELVVSSERQPGQLKAIASLIAQCPPYVVHDPKSSFPPRK